MKSWWATIAVATLAAIGVGSRVFGAEARPWLCRAKPVFSSDKPMAYQATNRGGGRWLMTFMRFDPSGLGHDGFTVSSTQDVATDTKGTLESGQWYAVALYRSSGHWICPGNAAESGERAPGVVSNLCYGREPGECTVKLIVRAQSIGSGPGER
ncbi:MAG: hypothetical protein JO071_05490 [Deltaproteobacteria bacterium]|nr:hypothetical protein [Deltaproteobacteria bacterium]